MRHCLEFEDVVVAVSELSESALDFSLLHAILESTKSGVLTGSMVRRIFISLTISQVPIQDNSRSANEELSRRFANSSQLKFFVARKQARNTYLSSSLLLLTLRQVFGDHVLGDEPLLTCHRPSR